MKETAFKHRVEELLKEEGAWFIKYWAGNKFTKEGIPDILACINGTFYGIELKADNGKPSLLQLINLKKIRASGGVGVLLYPEDLDYFRGYVHGEELSSHWYRNNKLLQREWFNKLNK